MNLLVDFLTAKVKTGAGEYLRRIFFELVKARREDIRLFGLWDSRCGIAYEDLQPEILRRQYEVVFFDCANKEISTIVEDERIDKFFISCGHYVGDYPGVADLRCKVVCVIHDCYAEELTNDHIYDYWLLAHGAYDFKDRFKSKMLNRLRNIHATWNLCKRLSRIRHCDGYGGMLAKLKPIIKLLSQNQQAELVTSSEFTRHTLLYHFGESIHSMITVAWAPSRIESNSSQAENQELARLVETQSKFLLMVSANREAKNPIKLLRAFERYQRYDKTLKLVMVGRPGVSQENVIGLPFLSDADLDVAFRNCHALIYPSYFEGFGYPPVEAMRYGKPVLAANVTSIPEVLGGAAIYFSPFYDADIFASMMKLSRSDYSELSKKSLERYEIIHEKQEEGLMKVVSLILK